MAKAGDKRSEKELRKEFFDGPASDSMSFEQFLIREGHGDKVKATKMADGGGLCSVRRGYGGSSVAASVAWTASQRWIIIIIIHIYNNITRTICMH